MENFNNINDAKVEAVKYFAENFGYFADVVYENIDGVYQFFSLEDQNTANKFYCTVSTKRGRPVTNKRVITKTAQKGLHNGLIRATFIIDEQLLEQVKAIAYWDRVRIQDVINAALTTEVNKFENKKKATVKKTFARNATMLQK
jgi:ClpP class serine protease